MGRSTGIHVSKSTLISWPAVARRLALTGLLLAALALAAVLAGCGSSKESVAVRVQITAPADGSTVRSGRVVVRGTVSPANATVQVTGRSAQVGDGIFSVSVPLRYGSNTIDVIASGAGAAPVTTTVTVKRPKPHKKAAPKSTQTGGTAPSTNNQGSGVAGRTSCGGGVWVGPSTSCAFAANVAAVYLDNPSSSIEAYSSVTNQWYTMSCSSGSPHVCTGGNNASVYFY